MRVFIVVEPTWDETIIHGVYASRERAERAVSEHIPARVRRGLEIDEYEVVE